MLRRITNRLRPVTYVAGNFVEPSYGIASVESSFLARAGSKQIRSAVRRRLHRYLHYCLAYSAYWQERWPAQCRRFRPDEAEDVLALLPPIGKDDLRRFGHLLHITPEQRARLDGYPSTSGQMTVQSGGSTGEPTEVWHDRRFTARNRAIVDHAYRIAGVVPGRPVFYLWGSNNELSDLKTSRRKRLSTWARGLIRMPAYALDRSRVLDYTRTINARPDVESAICFVSALDTFLTFVEHERLPLRRISRIVTGGGKLYPGLRERAIRLWSDHVYEVYGARDSGLMATEAADHGGLEIFPWHCYVEVLDAGQRVRKGHTGEIHVTCLQNYSCALIRLAMGDVAQYDESPRWNRPRIADITGRSAEHLTGPRGVRIDPSAVIHLIGVLEARPWMRRFQVVQTGPTEVVLRLEAWTDPDAREREQYSHRIGDALGRMMGAAVRVRTELTDRIPPAASGKHLYCIGWHPDA